MAEFLIELYVSRVDREAVGRDALCTRRAAAELSAEGRYVRYVRSIFVPEDETCFLLLEADTVETVHETARRAALPFERVVATAVDIT
jgi:Nickel responsive protein SCO4226-like